MVSYLGRAWELGARASGAEHVIDSLEGADGSDLLRRPRHQVPAVESGAGRGLGLADGRGHRVVMVGGGREAGIRQRVPKTIK